MQSQASVIAATGAALAAAIALTLFRPKKIAECEASQDYDLDVLQA